jgi:hypothetical protein
VQQAQVEHDHDETGGKLQENMKQIRALMARMQATTDAAQRRELLGQQLQLMREQVKLMLAQSDEHTARRDAGASAPGAHEDHTAQPGQGDMAAETKKCAMMEDGKCKMMENGNKGGMMDGRMMMMHKRMEQRVRMLEQLLEQIVERETVEHALESR